ncbi:PD-(D/E)XK motif protein [Undibacterium sp. TC4M20W]|uniref:PD-(D/E)XK motif protein n=1 Tax=Undibacterium sp. TC4M20W TaxID=3413052 RepID=UPI003BF2BCB7
MLGLHQRFIALPSAEAVAEFTAIPLSQDRRDFLAKDTDGGPVFLLHDASPIQYVVGRKLRHMSAEFHATCRVQTDDIVIDDQFAMIACDPTSPELHELFIRCVGAAVENLPPQRGTKELELCVHTLLDLFRTLSEPSTREVSGLWAELWVIAKSSNPAQALDVWHDDTFDRFDFSWESVCVEVKFTMRGIRVHEFALEQLSVPIEGQGYVVSLMLQSLTGG